MKNVALAAGLGALVLGIACTKKPEAAPVTTTKTKNAPTWIDNPQIPEGLAETGYAQANVMGDKGLQTSTALADGRRKLAEQVKVRVQGMFSQLNQQLTNAATDAKGKPMRNEVMMRMIDNVTRNIVDQELSGSTRRATWVDDNGDMYIHVMLSKEIVESALKAQANKEIRKEIQQGEKSLEAALDKLDAAIAAIK